MTLLHWAKEELIRTARWERVVFLVLWSWGVFVMPLALWFREDAPARELAFVVMVGAVTMPALLAVTLVLKFTGQQIWSRVRR